MPSFLLCYATGEGQTAKVAGRVASVVRDRGHDVDVVDLGADTLDRHVTDYDAVVVGGSIHMGKQAPAVLSFVRDNRAALSTLPSAFFQVCLSAADPEATRQAEAERYVDDLLAATGWDPDRVGVFGGALRYSEYGVVKRALMKRIAREATGDTDTSRDYEYTDWDAVERFARSVAGLVETGTDDSTGGDTAGSEERRVVQHGAVR